MDRGFRYATSSCDQLSGHASHSRGGLNDTSRFYGPERHTIAGTETNAARIETGISNDALDLLREALQGDGQIAVIKHFGGLHIQVGLDVTDTSTARLSAKWRSAVEELIDAGHISDVGHKAEIFEVTESGYKLCEAVAAEGT